ncbi:MAG: hypothetical protein ACK56F_32880, partial [bacterium]
AAMRPGELPGRVVAAAEVWLDDAYDNITLAQACLAVRSRREKKRVEVLEVLYIPSHRMERHRPRGRDACGCQGHFCRPRSPRAWCRRHAATPPKPPGPTMSTGGC